MRLGAGQGVFWPARGCSYWCLPDGDVGGAQGGVPSGVVLGGGAVAGAGLEQVGDGDEVLEHGLVGGAVMRGQQGSVGEDFVSLGADDAGVGFEGQVIGDRVVVAFDLEVPGHYADVVVEHDLGLSAARYQPFQRRVQMGNRGGGGARIGRGGRVGGQLSGVGNDGVRVIGEGHGDCGVVGYRHS